MNKLVAIGVTLAACSDPGGPGPARQQHAIVYDDQRERLVLVGGYDDIWFRHGDGWIRERPEGGPGVRSGHAMAYDTLRDRVVLFGGGTPADGQVAADTWEWDGERWIAMTPEISPPARLSASMAFDEAHARTVLFGGSVGDFGNRMGDTWVWDGDSWTQLFPDNAPPERYWHSMAYDRARSRVVLFGGMSLELVQDTWEWDGRDWTEVTSAMVPPSRVMHTVAYDLARERTVLFGGVYDWPAGDSLRDTWEWDGNAWTEMSPASRPPALSSHASAYDAARGRVVIQGGAQKNSPPQNDTWEWDGSDWAHFP